MTKTYLEATDAMFSEFSKNWGNACPIIWQGQSIQPPANQIWCEVYRQNVSEEQATLSGELGLGQGRRYSTNGILYIVLKSPVSIENNFEKLSKLAMSAKEIFRGRRIACDIIFKDCRIIEKGSFDNNNVIMVLCNYEYWEISKPVLYLPDDVWINGGVYMAGEKPLPRGVWSNGGVLMTNGAYEYENTINNGGVLCVPNFKFNLPDGLEINGGVYMVGSAILPFGLSSNGGVVIIDSRVTFENSFSNGGVLQKA